MPKPSKVADMEEAEEVLAEVATDKDKEELLNLYETMQKLSINSIGDVEVRLSRYN